MMTRFDPDIETAHVKPLVQRDPAADKARSWQKYRNALRGRRGAYNDLGPSRSPGLKSDGVKQVTRRQAVKKVRAIGHIEERWWRKYFRLFQEWMLDRTDIDEVGD